MKRLVVLFLTSLLLVACGTPSEEKDKAVATPTATAIPDADVEKEQVDINGHHYEYVRYKIRDGKIYLLSLKTKENDLIIPSEIEGIPVEEVGVDFYLEPENEGYEDFDVYELYWLLDKKQVYDKVIFSSGIHKVNSMIGIVAEEVIFGKDIEYIATRCLNGEISEVKVKNISFECRNVEIESSAFVHCSAEEVDFSPDFGGTIAMGAFSSNHIKKITWPGGKTKVGSEAFANNKELHTVIFPENCEEITIPYECFRGCENLNKLVFPAHVKKVVYESSACADNYDFQGVETLEFKGKDTELVGIRNEKRKLHKLITVKKIIAPKGSKAIDFAKKAQNVAYIKPETVRENGWMENPSNQRDNLGFHENSIRLGTVEWEYN